jgi:hypothetical protein
LNTSWYKHSSGAVLPGGYTANSRIHDIHAAERIGSINVDVHDVAEKNASRDERTDNNRALLWNKVRPWWYIANEMGGLVQMLTSIRVIKQAVRNGKPGRNEQRQQVLAKILPARARFTPKSLERCAQGMPTFTALLAHKNNELASRQWGRSGSQKGV